MTKSCLWRPELPSPNAWPLCSALCTKSCDGKFWEEQELKPVASWTSSSLFVPDLSAAGTPSPQPLGPKGSSCPCLSLCSSPTCCSDPFLDSLLCCSLVSQPCPILCSPVDYSPPVFSVRGILQVMGSHSLLQGFFPTQRSKLCLLHWQADSLPLSHLGSPHFCLLFIFRLLPLCSWLLPTSSPVSTSALTANETTCLWLRDVWRRDLMSPLGFSSI